MAWTNPRTWSAGETVTETIMNTHVRDQFKAIGDAWTSYTSTWTAASVNPAIGNGTNVGRYMQAGKLVHFYVTITMGSTTTFGTGVYSLTLPAAPVASRLFTFQGLVSDASAGNTYHPLIGINTIGGGSTIELRTDPTTAGNQLRGISPSTPFTFAQSDIMFVGGTYEAA